MAPPRAQTAAGAGVLASGQFLSPLLRQDRQEDSLLTELHQPEGRRMPWHEHEAPYVTVVLDGHCAENTSTRSTELPRFSAIFNPAGIAHETVVGDTGMRIFTIECSAAWLRALDLRLPQHPRVDLGMGSLLWPGLSIYSAFKARTADPLLLDSHLVELFGAIAGLADGDGDGDGALAAAPPPPWFHRLKEQLHGEFRDSLRIGALAAEAGVHPVHLARVFRRQESQSPGTYLQRLRVRAACERLRDRDAALAEIALDCGFADQSHFTRIFKRLVGSTPGAWRAALRARDHHA